jgi:hypothetical protein
VHTFDCDAERGDKNEHDAEKKEQVFDHFRNHGQLGSESAEEFEKVKQSHEPKNKIGTECDSFFLNQKIL